MSTCRRDARWLPRCERSPSDSTARCASRAMKPLAMSTSVMFKYSEASGASAKLRFSTKGTALSPKTSSISSRACLSATENTVVTPSLMSERTSANRRSSLPERLGRSMEMSTSTAPPTRMMESRVRRCWLPKSILAGRLKSDSTSSGLTPASLARAMISS